MLYIYPHIGGIKAALDLKNSNGILMGERSSSYGCMGSGFGCGNVWNLYKIIDKFNNQILKFFIWTVVARFCPQGQHRPPHILH